MGAPGVTPSVNALRSRAMECVKAGIQYPHNPAVRVAAIEAMESADRDDVLPWIRAALLDEQPAVRFAALLALGNAQDDIAASAIDRCVSDVNPSVRVAALYARHRLGQRDQSGKLPTYLLQHHDPMVRRNAAMVLGLLGETGAIPVLARAVKKDTEPGVRHHALEAMARLGNTEARSELTFATNSGVGSEEVMAVQALAATVDPKFAETFRYKLNSAAHVETRLAAARGLGLLGHTEGYDQAMDALTAPRPAVEDVNDPPAGQRLRVQLLAASALGAIGRPEALATLGETMETSGDPRVQLAAAQATLEIMRRSQTSETPFAPARGMKRAVRP